MLDKERGLYIAHCANGALSITGKMANRHGLIAGATGTGKTVTLQVMAETFCQAGVPCFMADMKGDLSGISQVGKMSGFIEKRLPEFGIENPQFQACPKLKQVFYILHLNSLMRRGGCLMTLRIFAFYLTIWPKT